jgi:hypothetical protein
MHPILVIWDYVPSIGCFVLRVQTFIWDYTTHYPFGFSPVTLLGLPHPLSFVWDYAPYTCYLGLCTLNRLLRFTHRQLVWVYHSFFIGITTHLLFGFYVPVISLGLRTHYFYLGLRTRYFLLGFTHPLSDLGLCTPIIILLGLSTRCFYLGLRTRCLLPGFTHPLFSFGSRTLHYYCYFIWVYATIIFIWVYVPVIFYSGLRTHYLIWVYAHPLLFYWVYAPVIFIWVYAPVVFYPGLRTCYFHLGSHTLHYYYYFIWVYATHNFHLGFTPPTILYLGFTHPLWFTHPLFSISEIYTLRFSFRLCTFHSLFGLLPVILFGITIHFYLFHTSYF